MKKILILFLLFYSSLSNALYLDVPGCGNLENAYGPFDYTNPIDLAKKLAVVEKHHFRPETERLIKIRGGNEVIDDLDYTLRAFPNHHRALMAMARYRLITPWSIENPRYRSADCYFKRAIAMNPADSVVYMIYGIYKHKLKKYDDAEKLYLKALSGLSASAELQYNLGLLYFVKENYEKSREHAKKAYGLGFPLKGLENKLKKKKAW